LLLLLLLEFSFRPSGETTVLSFALFSTDPDSSFLRFRSRIESFGNFRHSLFPISNKFKDV
jgi:hypothetical protein